jgi:hypothetical protein
VDHKQKMSLLDQIKAIQKAYFGEPEISIINYFQNCGILGDTPPATVLNHLTTECLYPNKKFKQLHLKHLKSYVEWRWNGEKNISDIFCDEFTYLFPQK